ncbi:CD209 antigen-like protein A [Labrus mixtus]|uniref:CD209 antigen-like protein A n=1 Tax=Labrus mixtus TaxID=508554 RepID=UPI0029C08BB7|nr:CD209 antigen-like protein A [Labrus mixtus]
MARLQTSNNNVTKERDQLQTSNNNVTKERDQLQTNLNGQQGWTYFSGTFYYISSLKKSWQESRAGCLNRGADLIIVNSEEEQNFARSFKQYPWMGLTDAETEGTWKWVDGTLLTTRCM